MGIKEIQSEEISPDKLIAEVKPCDKERRQNVFLKKFIRSSLVIHFSYKV